MRNELRFATIPSELDSQNFRYCMADDAENTRIYGGESDPLRAAVERNERRSINACEGGGQEPKNGWF